MNFRREAGKGGLRREVEFQRKQKVKGEKQEMNFGREQEKAFASRYRRLSC